jgi:hypothetical protein
MDPRVTTSATGLQQQFDLSIEAYKGIIEATQMLTEVNKANEALQKAQRSASGNAERARAIEALQQRLRELTGGRREGPGAPLQPTLPERIPLGRLAGSFTSMLDLLQDADVTPTPQAVRDLTSLRTALSRSRSGWEALRPQLRAAGIVF